MRKSRFFSLFFSLLIAISLFSPLTVHATEMQVAAKSALLADATSGELLLEQNTHQRFSPIGLTSVMTALLVLEAVEDGALSLEDSITITPSHLENLPKGSSTVELCVGESFTVSQLLSCILVVSGADASQVLACEVSGTLDAFVELMNTRASELGCTETHFTNPSGAEDVNQYTTAHDLWLIFQQAIRHDALTELSDQVTVVLPATAQSKERTFYSTNALVSQFRLSGYLYSRSRGVKATQSETSGYCLMTNAVKGETSLLCIILGAERIKLADGSNQTQSFSEAKRLCEWGFSSFSRKTLLTGREVIGTIPVTLSKTTNQVVVKPIGKVTRILPNSLDPKALTQTVTYDSESVPAPITAGDHLGWVVLSYEGVEYATVELVAAANVSASAALLFRQNVLDFLTSWVVIAFVLFVLLSCIGFFSWRFYRHYKQTHQVIRQVTQRGHYTGKRKKKFRK